MNIGIIGTGKVGSTLMMAFQHIGHHVFASSSRELQNAQNVASAADIVFLTVSDQAIEPVAARIVWRRGMGVVHCSGSLDSSALAMAAEQGARTASFHPLQMFADLPSALAHLSQTTVTIEGDDSLVRELEKLARELRLTPLRLRVRDRALYHCSVNYAGPFLIALLHEAARLWVRTGLTEEEALKALVPLAHGTLAGVTAAGLAGGMGGAVARGDTPTIKRHIEALQRNAPDQLELYCKLSRLTIPIAIQRGTLRRDTADGIWSLLGDGDRHRSPVDE